MNTVTTNTGSSNWNTAGLTAVSLNYVAEYPRDLCRSEAGLYVGEWLLFGTRVQRNDSFRPGTLVLNYPQNVTAEQLSWSASELTMTNLDYFGKNGSISWRGAMEMVYNALVEGHRDMKTVMVDLSRVASFKKPTAKPVGRTRDRVDSVCVSIAGLVAELAPFCEDGGRTASDAQMQAFAVKYGKLRDEMRKLRTAMDHADGMFEVAQMQIVALMNEDEVDV